MDGTAAPRWPLPAGPCPVGSRGRRFPHGGRGPTRESRGCLRMWPLVSALCVVYAPQAGTCTQVVRSGICSLPPVSTSLFESRNHAHLTVSFPGAGRSARPPARMRPHSPANPGASSRPSSFVPRLCDSRYDCLVAAIYPSHWPCVDISTDSAVLGLLLPLTPSPPRSPGLVHPSRCG